MAEKFVLGLAQSILGILGTYAGDKITSASVANEELKKLERSLNLICPFIKDAENKLSSSTSSTEQGNEGIKKWLMELKNVIYDIEDLLDEAATDALRLEVMKIGGRGLDQRLKIKDLRGRLDQIAADVGSVGLIASHTDTLASVQVVGSMLRGERDERQWRRIAENDLWKHGDVLAALRLSYNDLPSHLKLCFAYLSVYPKGDALRTYHVVCMMAAQGLITDKDNVDGENWEETGERYMKELLSRSLLQEPNVGFEGKLLSFKMHDLVHDLALDVMGEELAIVTDSNDHPKVSRFVRHISWCREHLPSEKEILQAHQVRTFFLPYIMTPTDKICTQQVVSSFKRLRTLDLAGTDIEELPDSIGDLKHLRCLFLYDNVRLKALPNSICKLLNLQTLELSGCEQLEKLPEDIGKLINLTYLSLTLSSQSKYLIPKRMKVIRSSLRYLFIYKCSELISLLEEEEKDDVSKNIIFLTELRTIEIVDCPKFSPHLSNSLRYLTSLNRLVIRVSEEVDGQMELPPQPKATVGGMKPDGLRSLKYLAIDGMQTVVGLPDVFQTAATSLRYLQLWKCARLKSLPEWLRNFKSLSHLKIIDCPQLSTLPSDGFLGLTSLQKLRIRGCPHLSVRCSEKGWDYWPRNCQIKFDGKRIHFKGKYVEESKERKN